MAIDPNIALSFKPIDVSSADERMANAQKLQQGDIANKSQQFALDQAVSTKADSDQARQIMMQANGDHTKAINDLNNAGYSNEAQKLQKFVSDNTASDDKHNEASLKLAHDKADRVGQAYMSVAQSSDADTHNVAFQSIKQLAQTGDIAPDEANQMMSQIGSMNPADIRRYAQTYAGQALSAKDQLPKPSIQNLGDREQPVSQDIYGHVTQVGSPMMKQISPDTKAISDRMANNKLQNIGVTNLSGLTPEEEAVLYPAMNDGRIDPNKVNSKTAKILAGALLQNPKADLANVSGDIALGRNAGFRAKAMVAETLPEIMTNMVDTGKKLDFSDMRAIGKMQAWTKGQFNDPTYTQYMSQRNDALMTIAGVMRGAGMTDQAHRAETEVAAPTMSPDALDAWYKGQIKSLEPRLKQYRKITKSKDTPDTTDIPSAPLSNTNAKGWVLHQDAKGNKAYVSPDGKQVEEVK